jgi:hypothetical protein
MRENAKHQVMYKIEERRDGEVFNTKIHKLSRKTLKQSGFSMSSLPQNLMISYGYEDYYGVAGKQTFTQVLQIFVKVDNKKAYRGTYG